tara:strand:- start:858995 stop:859456 length:462 start_codon:yes stop_codon:yes gene_type:complete
MKFEDPLSDFEPIAYESELHRALAEESVDTIESQPYVWIEPSATIRESIRALHNAKVSSLLVVSEGAIVGIFTERDVLEKVAEQYSRLAETAVSEVMTTNPTVIYETDPAATALAAIAVEGHRHVPVLGVDDSVHGIVSPRRAFHFVQQYDRA